MPAQGVCCVFCKYCAVCYYFSTFLRVEKSAVAAASSLKSRNKSCLFRGLMLIIIIIYVGEVIDFAVQ